MTQFITRFISFWVLGIVYFLATSVSYGLDYQYSVSLDLPVSRYFVRPDFDTVGTEFTVHNSGDPVYVELQLVEQHEFAITIYEVMDGQYQAINESSVSLLLPNSSKQYRVEISRSDRGLTPKDYLVDLYVSLKPIQKPKNMSKPLIVEPKIHKYVVLSVTEDGTTNIDPKIALFQNLSGPVSLLSGSQQMLITLQNRGNHMFGTAGTLTIRGPAGFEETFTIPTTYIFANSQKNLSVEGQNNSTSVILTQQKLRTGQYTASVDLTILGTSTPRLFAQTTFWMLSPVIVIASVLFCLMIIIIIFFIGIRHV